MRPLRCGNCQRRLPVWTAGVPDDCPLCGLEADWEYDPGMEDERCEVSESSERTN